MMSEDVVRCYVVNSNGLYNVDLLCGPFYIFKFKGLLTKNLSNHFCLYAVLCEISLCKCK